VDVNLIIGVSILLQVIAALLALRLIRVTGVSVAWVLVAVAVLLMAARRGVSLMRALAENTVHQPDLTAELLALLISFLLLAGIAGISPLFQTLRRNQQALQESESRYRELNRELERRVERRASELAALNETLDDSVASLRDTKEKLAEAQRMAHIGSWELDIVSGKLWWSEEIYRIFELDPDQFEASYDTFLAAIHPDDREQVHAAYHASVEEKTSYDIVHRLLMPDGRIKFVRECCRTFYDDRGNALRSFGTVQDITQQKQAELAVTDANLVWTHAMEFFEDAVYMVDLDDKVVRANPAFYRMTGLTPEQALGSDIGELLHPDGEPEPCPVCAARRARRNARIIMEADHPDNPTGRPIEVTLTVIRDDQGEAIRILMWIHELTRQRAIERELRQHRDHLEELVSERTRELKLQAQIIDQIHDSVVSTDLDGVVTSWNKGAERQFGYSADEAVGQHIAFVYPEDEHRFLERDVIGALKEKGEHDVEVRMRKKDNSEFFAHLSLSMLYDKHGVPQGMIGYSMDITERKRAQMALQEQADILAATNRELEAFSYSVSHDLRAPLRAIDGFSQLLIEDFGERLDATGKDYIDRVRAAAQRMGELIDELLELARVARYDIAKENLDLSAIAETSIDKLREADPERIVDVSIMPGLRDVGDRRLIGVLLDNLLSNAWKYTARADKPRIEFSMNEVNGERVYRVCDNGVGFNMDYVDKLFSAFQRLHGKEYEGSGIGLATVHRIVQRHGGRVWGEGEEGKGAAFYFTLAGRKN